MFSKSEIAQLRDRFPELRVYESSSIDQRLIDNILFNRREALRECLDKLPALKTKAEEAYQAAFDGYLAKRPNGKNAAKAGLRAAREIWNGFQK